MRNLVTETEAYLREHGYSSADVLYGAIIGTARRCGWAAFVALAERVTYDAESSRQQIAPDLVVVGWTFFLARYHSAHDLYACEGWQVYSVDVTHPAEPLGLIVTDDHPSAQRQLW